MIILTNHWYDEAVRLRCGIIDAGKRIEVFHRTGGRERDIDKLSALAKQIIRTGLIAGNGSTYGKGLYFTSDWLSQFAANGKSTMTGLYGPVLLKFVLPTRGILAFDYRMAQAIYGASRFKLSDQWQALHPGHAVPGIIQILSRDLMQTLVRPEISANRAKCFWGDFLYEDEGNVREFWNDCIARFKCLSPDITEAYEWASDEDFKNIDIYRDAAVTGIAYHGTHDGNVVFVKASRANIVKPIAWCIMDPAKPYDPSAFLVRWTKV